MVAVTGGGLGAGAATGAGAGAGDATDAGGDAAGAAAGDAAPAEAAGTGAALPAFDCAELPDDEPLGAEDEAGWPPDECAEPAAVVLGAPMAELGLVVAVEVAGALPVGPLSAAI